MFRLSRTTGSLRLPEAARCRKVRGFEITHAKDIYALNLNIWKQIRHQTACCFEQSRDALFELVDALSSEAQARTLPELSLSPSFRRKWQAAMKLWKMGGSICGAGARFGQPLCCESIKDRSG